jgi:hypothetical protein
MAKKKIKLYVEPHGILSFKPHRQEDLLTMDHMRLACEEFLKNFHMFSRVAKLPYNTPMEFNTQEGKYLPM